MPTRTPPSPRSAPSSTSSAAGATFRVARTPPSPTARSTSTRCSHRSTAASPCAPTPRAPILPPSVSPSRPDCSTTTAVACCSTRSREADVTVYLVGAGPGDPGLLTQRGATLLSRADVVVHDRLGTADLLALAPPDAELISAGKAPGQVDLTQDEINSLLVARGRAGVEVVRLKGGDPFVFGRGGEEAEALAAAGVPFEIVPGITSAIGAPAYAGIPVTHRGLSTHFTVVTGNEDPTKDRTDVDWDALARSGGTLVILMGAARVGAIAERLMAAGLPGDTLVAAVRNGTRPDQQTVRATLATVAATDVRAPSAIVVGAVAGLELAWFEHRPLFGSTIVVTRAREQASDLRAQLEALGAAVVELPAITIEPLDFTVPDLAAYEWLVFTSANGVTAWFDRGLAPMGL